MKPTHAHAAIQQLIAAMRQRTGQGYKLRALLYSLWNGKPASLLNIVDLDPPLRAALLAVLAVFGRHDFFYDEIKAHFVEAGLFEWFTEEGDRPQ